MRCSVPFILTFIAAFTLYGCATMPPELAAGGPYAGITPAQALQGGAERQRVRWGGAVVQARPQGEQTCFEVVGLELDARGEPLDSDTSTGRFLACARGFYDPAIYNEGRYVTFTGRLEGAAPQQIGERSFQFPKLQADQVYLWPKRREVRYVPYPVPYWDPFYDPYWRYERLQ